LYDEDAILDDMQENLVFEAGEKVDLTKRNKGKQQKKGEESEEEEEAEEGVRVSKKKKKIIARLSKEKLDELDKEKFDIEYYKSGGIQHIICSATLTINEKGRMTPKSVKALKRKI
jgi:NCAIR mutase (PurE)-related protein